MALNELPKLSPAAEAQIRRIREQTELLAGMNGLASEEEKNQIRAKELARLDMSAALNKQAAATRKVTGSSSPLAGLTNADPRLNPEAAAAAGAVAAIPIKV